MISKQKAKLIPTPEGRGWITARHFANSRVPITAAFLARTVGDGSELTEDDAERLLVEASAENMGWFRVTNAGYQGRL